MSMNLECKTSNNILSSWLPSSQSIINTSDSVSEYTASGREKLEEMYQLAPTMQEIGMNILRVIVWRQGLGSISIISGIDVSDPMIRCSLNVITGALAVTMELYPHFLQYNFRKLCVDQTKKNVILICKATADWNGSFSRISKDYINSFKKMTDTHSIVFLRISTLEDINEAIDSITAQGRNITHLFLKAHGAPDAIMLGTDQLVMDKKFECTGSWYFWPNKKSVEHIHFSKLDPYACLIFDSCSTGSVLPYPQLNFAECVQYRAGPTRKVYAPDAPCSGLELNENFEPQFGDARTADISYETAFEKYQQPDKF